jgi:hypothetical protein
MRDTAKDAEIVRADGKTAWTWKQNGNFSEKTFRADYPDLVASYTTTVEVIDTARLKAEQAEAYRKSRGRRLHVPAKGI